jgi:hypothetical protein
MGLAEITIVHKLRGNLMGIRFSAFDRSKKIEIFILIACLLIGFTLRFYTFDQKSLWIDEIHTYNDSRDSLKGQIKFYERNPTYLHPPLFFLLTHLFYPFQKPERDLRILPLIFGTLSIPMIFFLSKLFSPSIALPCTLSLTFMAYHISLSQDGRSYSFIMFLGMVGLYLFMKHLKTSKRVYLLFVSTVYVILFYTSYSSIPFIALSQILFFYRDRGEVKGGNFRSFLTLNGLFFLLCIPWIIFLAFNYRGQPMMNPLHTESPDPFWTVMFGVLHDWVPHAPLMIASVILLILFPIFSIPRRNAILLLAVFILPIGAVNLGCQFLHITHFITSRYFINFLPLFIISIFLSLNAVEFKFEKLKRVLRLELLFIILFIASNLSLLPFYYRSEKQDLRGLVTYLKNHLRRGDVIFTGTEGYFPGILHYFGARPEDRHYTARFWKDSGNKMGFQKSFTYQDKTFTIYHSKTCCTQYVADGNRLWIIVGKHFAKEIKKNSPAVLKGYFDGSFLNYIKFPTDVSIYLFLWDPQSPDERGIDMPIE